MFRRLFKRKEGGSFFGNLIRNQLDVRTGGILHKFIQAHL